METVHSSFSSASVQDSVTSNYLDLKNQELSLNEIRKQNGGETFLKTLACMKRFFQDGRLHYRDNHTGEMNTAERVIIVQSFSKKGICTEHWLTPFCGTLQCKNALEIETAENGIDSEAHLSRSAKGCDLGYKEINALTMNGTSEQKLMFRHDVNTLFTISNLEKLV